MLLYLFLIFGIGYLCYKLFLYVCHFVPYIEERLNLNSKFYKQSVFLLTWVYLYYLWKYTPIFFDEYDDYEIIEMFKVLVPISFFTLYIVDIMGEDKLSGLDKYYNNLRGYTVLVTCIVLFFIGTNYLTITFILLSEYLGY